MCAMGDVGLLWVGHKGLPEVEGQGTVGPNLNLEQFILPQVPVEG